MLPAILAIVAGFCTTSPAQNTIRGFTEQATAAQLTLEAKARSIPEARRIRTYMRRMSQEPHHAGSPGSRAVAEYALGLFKEWGFDARIETFEGLLPYPRESLLELTAPVRHRAKLTEPPIQQDPDSFDSRQLPAFNAYSADGDVTGPLVYVNYGMPEDFDYLRRQGVDVRGKIVIARYGRTWRGSKSKIAQEQGAAGCILYSDPHDDGYYRGETFPNGPFRPAAGVQRGSVLDMTLHVGDPLSPGWASERGSRRLDIAEASTLMKIPVLPISYADALELLRHLGGPVVPESWRGALGLTYHIGPGPAAVRLKVASDWSTRPLYNVIATLAGSTWPDQWVMYGNHHDAWVKGASDPGSGASALLETARTLAELRNSGWRPKRTIRFALWDGEEFGLIGSTEWLEKHKPMLDRRLAVYLNSDVTGKGRLVSGGSHSLETFLGEVLGGFKNPLGVPLDDKFKLDSLGAGSDYVAFLHHGGIASLNLGFGGEDAGVYHSAYDSFEWYTRYSDTGFDYSRTFSGLQAVILLRLADAPLLPFEFGAPARAMQGFIEELDRMGWAAGGKLDLKPIQAELAKLAVAAKQLESARQSALRHAGRWKDESLAAVNEALFRTERALLSEGGLPKRPWYRHQIYAPGLYTGYAAKTLPGVREAIEAGRWEEANRQAIEVAKVIRALSRELARITGLVKAL